MIRKHEINQVMDKIILDFFQNMQNSYSSFLISLLKCNSSVYLKKKKHFNALVNFVFCEFKINLNLIFSLSYPEILILDLNFHLQSLCTCFSRLDLLTVFLLYLSFGHVNNIICRQYCRRIERARLGCNPISFRLNNFKIIFHVHFSTFF